MMRLIVVLAMLPALAFGATTTVTRAVVANTNNLITSHTNLTLNGTATVYAVKFADGTSQTTAGGGGGGSGTLTNIVSTSALLTVTSGGGPNVTLGMSAAVATGEQWNASVAAVGLLASNAVPITGGSFTGSASKSWTFLGGDAGGPSDGGGNVRLKGGWGGDDSGANGGTITLEPGPGQPGQASAPGSVNYEYDGVVYFSFSPTDNAFRAMSGAIFAGNGAGLTNLQSAALVINHNIDLAGYEITGDSFVGGSVQSTLFTGNAKNLTNLPVYIASGGTVAQTSTGAVLTITGGGGSAALSPWTNNVNAAGYTLTNTLAIAWTNASISVDSGGTNIVWTVGTNSFRLPIP